MTTYAPNFTPRAKLKYSACGIEHTAQIRGPRGADAATMVTHLNAIRVFFTQVASILTDDITFLSAEYAATDSDLWVPMALPAPVTGTIDPTTFSLKQRCYHTNVNGKASGSRAAIYLYGLKWEDAFGEAADNGRVFEAESAVVTPALNALVSYFYAGSGQLAVPHRYFNIKLNDHLLKLLRKGTIS